MNRRNMPNYLPNLRNDINQALDIMDSKGKSNEDDNSTMLWHKDWKDLRNILFGIKIFTGAAAKEGIELTEPQFTKKEKWLLNLILSNHSYTGLDFDKEHAEVLRALLFKLSSTSPFLKSKKDDTPGFAHVDYHGGDPDLRLSIDNIEVKTTGQLLDELIIENLKIWHLVDRAKEEESTYVQGEIQEHNDIRRNLVRAIDKRLGERDIGGRV
jgi:hypothetical protein